MNASSVRNGAMVAAPVMIGPFAIHAAINTQSPGMALKDTPSGSTLGTMTTFAPQGSIFLTGANNLPNYGIVSRSAASKSADGANSGTGISAGGSKINNTGSAFAGPIRLVFKKLTRPGTLASGASVTITTNFDNPARGAVNYTPLILSGVL